MSSAVMLTVNGTLTLDVDLGRFFHSFNETQAFPTDLIRQLCGTVISQALIDEARSSPVPSERSIRS